jgi:hypothetical protein
LRGSYIDLISTNAVGSIVLGLYTRNVPFSSPAFLANGRHFACDGTRPPLLRTGRLSLLPLPARFELELEEEGGDARLAPSAMSLGFVSDLGRAAEAAGWRCACVRAWGGRPPS